MTVVNRGFLDFTDSSHPVQNVVPGLLKQRHVTRSGNPGWTLAPQASRRAALIDASLATPAERAPGHPLSLDPALFSFVVNK